MSVSVDESVIEHQQRKLYLSTELIRLMFSIELIHLIYPRLGYKNRHKPQSSDFDTGKMERIVEISTCFDDSFETIAKDLELLEFFPLS